MKYEVLKAEIIRVEDEDILTLSNEGEGSGDTASWNGLDWKLGI